ncbi:hypothetical protein [Paraburkholderia lacunae]|nr:hypothetical protein [Paraburkholderia lacunae]
MNADARARAHRHEGTRETQSNAGDSTRSSKKNGARELNAPRLSP